jgi:hypothetical protein
VPAGSENTYVREKAFFSVSDALRPFYRVLGKSADLAET